MSKELIADYEDLGVSCGYIGNLERWGDDREWCVFTDLRSVNDPTRSISISVEPSKFDTPKTRERLDFLRARKAEGKLTSRA